MGIQIVILGIGVWLSCRREDLEEYSSFLCMKNSVGDLFSFCIAHRFISYFSMAFITICPTFLMPFLGHDIELTIQALDILVEFLKRMITWQCVIAFSGCSCASDLRGMDCLGLK